MQVFNMIAIGLPIVIAIILIVVIVKIMIKKKNVTVFYTPFDQITGHTNHEFHEEQQIIVEDERESDPKK